MANNAYDGLNRDAAIAAVTGGYDARGNLTFDGTRTFAYDIENRLTSVSGSPGVSLAYDPLGRLRTTTAGSTTTTFLYDGDRLVAEYDGSSLLRRYVHGPGVDEPLVWYEGSGTTDRRWLHTDHLGTVIMETNGSGVRLNRYTYGSWGEPGVGGWTGSRFRYTGQIAIPEAQLYHYKARVYDPTFGRFLQTDPVGYEDDLNLYAYAKDDPVNGIDPEGTDSLQVGINVQVGPFRWTWGSYRVGEEKGAILNPTSSTGRFSSHGGGIGLALGVEVQGTYCGECSSISDIAGESASAQGDIGIGFGVGETSAKTVPDGFGGTMKKGGTGKTTATVSFGPSVGLVPIGGDKTKVAPYSGEGVDPPPPPPPPPPSLTHPDGAR